jgi:DNA polymerase III subunit delta'
MNDAVLHSLTEQVLSNVTQRPPHALLVTAPRGMGKMYTVEYLLSRVLDMPIPAIRDYPYGTLIVPDGASISIEAIRGLLERMTLRTTGSRPIRRFAIIDQAELMTIEAQNTLLKLLEEPPADTIIILMTSKPQELLATIRSRCQRLDILAPDPASVQTYFARQYASATPITLQRYMALSAGRPGLLNALLQEDTTHPLVQAITIAKRLLGASMFERLCLVDELAKQKTELGMTLQALAQVASAGLQQAARKNQPSQLRNWYKVLQSVTEAEEALSTNVQSKLVLTNLMLAL